MISTTQLIRDYRQLRQHSPFYDGRAEGWQVADYESVRTVLGQVPLASNTTRSSGKTLSGQAIADYLQTQSVGLSGDLVQDVLEPLSDALLHPFARQMVSQVMPHLADALTDYRVVHTLQSLLMPSNRRTETAVQQIIQHEFFIALAGSVLYMLLMHPAQFALLQAHPEYIPRAVQEVLRLAPPVHRLRWQAPVDIVLSQSVIKSGQAIDIIAAAAGRDALVYRNADVFDMRRRLPRPVLLLHEAWIPREAVVVFLQQLLPMMRGIHLRPSGTVIWHDAVGWYRLKSLHVTVSRSAKK